MGCFTRKKYVFAFRLFFTIFIILHFHITGNSSFVIHFYFIKAHEFSQPISQKQDRKQHADNMYDADFHLIKILTISSKWSFSDGVHLHFHKSKTNQFSLIILSYPYLKIILSRTFLQKTFSFFTPIRNNY